MKRNNNQEVETHPLAGRYDMDGTITGPDGRTYTFKCAQVRHDPSGPDVRGFKPCTLHILVNRKAFESLAYSAVEEPEELPVE